MSENPRKALMKEAAAIFLRLRDNPADSDALAMRDEFISRGEEESQVYDHLLKTWKASGVAKGPKTLKSILLVCCLLTGATAFLYDPVRILFLADLSTNATPQQSKLQSGDMAYLDADTAIIDKTDGEARDIEVLDGAVFFAVESDPRPFTVAVGDIAVTVLGTEFEVALVDAAVFVSVAEGKVDVSHNNQSWVLEAGNRFKLSENSGVVIEPHDPANTAGWRSDRLVVDGLTMGQAAAIIERRLTGPIVFTDNALRDTVVAGNVDLSDPLLALRILADTVGGRVYNAPGIGRSIARK